MNKLSIFVLKASRKIYAKIFGGYKLPALEREEDPDKVSDMIYNLLESDKPCMIARYGATELSAIVNYLGVSDKKTSCIKYIKGQCTQWWWDERVFNRMQTWSGFFPPTPEKISQFCELMLEDSKEVDILGSWIANESYVSSYCSNASRVKLMLLEPFWSSKPWSRVLANKRVLVVHPFADTILSQYEKREHLFSNKDTIPTFKSLEVIKAVQSLGGDSNGHSDWFSALEYMKAEIDKCEYDICIIGAGAYGFPLAAHVKQQGKQGFHIGGALQLLFGIRGNRWENPSYGVKKWGLSHSQYSNLVNEYWVKPSDNDRPVVADKVEGACYW